PVSSRVKLSTVTCTAPSPSVTGNPSSGGEPGFLFLAVELNVKDRRTLLPSLAKKKFAPTSTKRALDSAATRAEKGHSVPFTTNRSASSTLPAGKSKTKTTPRRSVRFDLITLATAS